MVEINCHIQIDGQFQVGFIEGKNHLPNFKQVCNYKICVYRYKYGAAVRVTKIYMKCQNRKIEITLEILKYYNL